MADLPVQEDEQKGVPAWMLTYSDTITLMLCFFVMMLTFSGSSEETYGPAHVGVLKGARTPDVFNAAGKDSLVAEQPRLAAGRMAADGAEKPPLHEEPPLDELKHYYPEVDIASLKDLKGAVLARIPLQELFAGGSELAPGGQRLLDYFVKMAHGRAYSIVVHAKAAKGVALEQRQERSVQAAMRVVGYLRLKAGDVCPEMGVSDDAEFAQPPVADDECEIVMLEL